MDYISLDGDWTLQEALGHEHIPARVPGSVLGDLLANGLIDDPFFRENELDALRLFDRDYTYEKAFDVPSAVLAREKVELVFQGLDTLADVSLNGEHVLWADNMHRTWRVDVKRLLKPEGNRLEVVFRSPNRFIAQASRQNPDVTYDGTGYTMGSNFLRKAHCMFGWDWGPQLPDAGVWRPCGLEAYDRLRIASVEILQYHAEGRVRLSVAAQAEGERPHALRVTVIAPDGARSVHQAEGDAVPFTLDHPRLWQPNGWGEHPLYTFTVACMDEAGTVLAETVRRVGLRTVEISQQPDAWGSEFCFKVNGNKIFSMGGGLHPRG